MEKIKEKIDKLENPFEINKFINLLNMYINSEDWNDFYRSVVTYYPNSKQTKGTADNIKEINDFVTKEGMDPWIKYEYFSKFFPTEHRVYINSPVDINKEFVELFISKCINENIPFELKYLIERTNRSDGIVIGGNSSVFFKQIEILRGIADEHPEYIERCETPHLLTANLDGWMGIADENVDNRYHSFTQSRLGLIVSTCNKFLLSHTEYKDKISEYDTLLEEYNYQKSLIEKRVKRGEIPENEKDINISRELTRKFTYYFQHESHLIDFKEFVGIINSNPQYYAKELYDIFKQECINLGIDPDMPIFYKDSKEDLLSAEKNSRSDKGIDLQDKDFINLINEHLMQDYPTEQKLQIIKSIETNMHEYFSRIEELIKYINILTDEKEQTDFEKELLASINETAENSMIGNKKYSKSKNEIVFGERENSDNEPIRENFLERKKEMLAFIKNGLTPKEEIEKSISVLELFIKGYEEMNPVPDFNFGVTSNFEAKLNFLRFEIDNYDVLQNFFNDNVLKLEDIEYTDEELKELYKNNQPAYRPTNIDFESRVGLDRISEGKMIVTGIDEKEEQEVDDSEWYNW